MNMDKVYITANPTPNPDSLKFIIDRSIVEGDPVSFSKAEECEGSPLAQKIFDLGNVSHLFAFQNFITVTQNGEASWPDLARQIGQTIRSQVIEGGTLFTASTVQKADSDDESVAKIQAVLEEIRPAVAMDGGNITFAGYHNGVVQVLMQGACQGCPSSTMTLKSGIEARLREVMPEIKAVVAI